MAVAYISLGSNLGHRESCIRKAIRLLGKGCGVLKISSIYETEPVGCNNQPHFLNCAVKIETKLKPQELLAFAQHIENCLGRKRGMKFGPRTIDIDIIFYGDKAVNEENLVIPHPRAHERRFVLEPLKEIEPGLMHPALKKKIAALIENVKEQQKVAVYKRLRQ